MGFFGSKKNKGESSEKKGYPTQQSSYPTQGAQQVPGAPPAYTPQGVPQGYPTQNLPSQPQPYCA